MPLWRDRLELAWFCVRVLPFVICDHFTVGENGGITILGEIRVQPLTGTVHL